MELGLSLNEVADAVAGDDSADLREVLAELDADFARQAEVIAARRARIAQLSTIWTTTDAGHRWRPYRFCR